VTQSCRWHHPYVQLGEAIPRGVFSVLKTSNLLEELDLVTDFWSPRIIARVNDQYVKVAKLKGTLTWHKHDDEDELFQIVKGNLTIEYENEEIHLKEGDMHVVPKGVLHNPVADDECWIALIETVTTKHTGDVVVERTKTLDQQLPQ
jgi:mannose-6-phosphate isomerase-like protein (cupin superfamily)